MSPFNEMAEMRERAQSAADRLVKRCGFRPRVALMLGTGHVEFAGRLEDKQTFHVEDFPEFPKGVESSTLVSGRAEGVPIILADAPLAPYLGVTGHDLAFPVRVVRRMGAEFLVLTAGAAALTPEATPGSLGLVCDHLNFSHINPLIGRNDELLGPRFPDLSEPYDPELRDILRGLAHEAGFPLVEGVFAAIQGPSLPTRAEYRHLRSTGADFVGMSTVPEVLAAVHVGLRVAAILGVTQCVDPADAAPTDLEKMVDAADLAAPRVSTMLAGLLEAIAKS